MSVLQTCLPDETWETVVAVWLAGAFWPPCAYDNLCVGSKFLTENKGNSSWSAGMFRRVSGERSCDWAAAADILHFVQRIPRGAAGRMRTTHQGGRHTEIHGTHPPWIHASMEGAWTIVRCRHWHWWVRRRQPRMSLPEAVRARARASHLAAKVVTPNATRNNNCGVIVMALVAWLWLCLCPCLVSPQLHCKFVKQ